MGALAGIELAHNGDELAEPVEPEPRWGSPAGRTWSNDPVQACMMSASDLADLRRWHARQFGALAAGYDVIYVYSGHNLSMLHHFLSRRYNQRTDSTEARLPTGRVCWPKSWKIRARNAKAGPPSPAV
jgi:dimethylamine/trimethylamine dehydrogenase